MKNDIIRGCTL